jgi:predicted acylesterase/phospholipase RssA
MIADPRSPAAPAPDAARKQKRVIVLSGGGANGAYEVGVLKALLSGGCRALGTVVPHGFFGTSVGSYNASFMVAQWDEFGPAAAANLERTWMEVLAGDAGSNGVFRLRGEPAYFLNPASYLPNPLRPLLELGVDGAFLTWLGIQRGVYLATNTNEELRERLANLFDFSALLSTEPWRRTIASTIDFSAIRRCDSQQLRVAATNWATGQLRIFKNHDMTDRMGEVAVLASSAIPGVLPVVMVGAEPYVDGSVLMNTPLRPAMDEGADVIYVVYLDPNVAAIPLSTLSSTIAATYRLQQISWAALVNAEVDRARRINRGLAALHKVRSGEPIEEAARQELAKGAALVLGGDEIETYRPITIHRFSPGDDLAEGSALGLLNLSPEHLDDLIQKGFTDATLHNCVEQGCVLPEPALLAENPLESYLPGRLEDPRTKARKR